MKYLELIRQIIIFPFRIIIFPLKIVILLPLNIVFGFLATNFNDEWDRNYYKKTIKDCFKFY